MPGIKLTPELLEEGASKLKDANAKNEDVINRLDNLMANLVNDWEGEAQAAFRDSYARKRETFQSVSVDMQTFVEFLNRFADIMRQEEQRQRDKAAGLA